MSGRVVICRSNPIAPDPRVEKEARSLSGAGYSVTVLAWDRSGQLPKHQICDGATIIRMALKADYARGLLNILPLLRWQLGLLSWLLKHRRGYDLIHACDFDTILPALLVKMLFGKKVIYDIFDFYADHLRATPHIIKIFIRSIDLWAIGVANAIILVDESRLNQIESSKPKRIAFIYNSPEEDQMPCSKKEKSNSELRIGYVGLLQVERGLLKVLEIMQKHPAWFLDIAGFGGDEAKIVNASAELSNVKFHGRVTYQKALEISNNVDVLFALYDPRIPNHRYSSPNKVFEAMMLGKPIIVASGTNMDQIVSVVESGLVVEYDNLHSIELAFEHLSQNPELLEELGGNAREAYDEKYSWKIMQQRLLDLYHSLLPIN